MKVEHLHKFIRALQSGAYKQIQGGLANCEGFCATALLAEVIEPGCITVGEMYGVHRFGNYQSGAYLVTEFLDHYAIPRWFVQWLQNCNDDGMEFKDIAIMLDNLPPYLLRQITGEHNVIRS